MSEEIQKARLRSVQHNLPNIRNLYHDLTLICGDQRFQTHRMVLPLHSSFFAKALSGAFKEGNSDAKLFDLSEEDPIVVQAALDFFYDGDYIVPKSVPNLVFHFKMYKLAGFFVAEHLKNTAMLKFETACDKEWTMEEFAQMASVFAVSEGMLGALLLKGKAFESLKRELPRVSKLPSFRTFAEDHPHWMVDLVQISANDKVTTEPDQPAALPTTHTPLQPAAPPFSMGAIPQTAQAGQGVPGCGRGQYSGGRGHGRGGAGSGGGGA